MKRIALKLALILIVAAAIAMSTGSASAAINTGYSTLGIGWCSRCSS